MTDWQWIINIWANNSFTFCRLLDWQNTPQWQPTSLKAKYGSTQNYYSCRTFNANQKVIGELLISDYEEFSRVWWCGNNCSLPFIEARLSLSLQCVSRQGTCWGRLTDGDVGLLRLVDQKAVDSARATSMRWTVAGPRRTTWGEVENTDGDTLPCWCFELPRLTTGSTPCGRLCLYVDWFRRRHRHRT